MSSAERKTDLRAVASSLDERDRAILQALLEHKVLTTRNLKSLFFASLRRCQDQLSELKSLELVGSFQPPEVFGRGRSPEHHFLTGLGTSVLAHLERVPRGQLPWVPDEDYRSNRNLRHRIGLNDFFCSLVEASRNHPDQGLHRWLPERKVRTRAGEIQPDGFGRYLHPGGACEFYLEYDRATEGPAAISEKLRGYRRFAAGWGDAPGFPNVLVLVPDTAREEKIAALARPKRGGRGGKKLALPVFLSSEELITARGVLGAVWAAPGTSERLSLTELPAKDGSPYDVRNCLGRVWTGGDG